MHIHDNDCQKEQTRSSNGSITAHHTRTLFRLLVTPSNPHQRAMFIPYRRALHQFFFSLSASCCDESFFCIFGDYYIYTKRTTMSKIHHEENFLFFPQQFKPLAYMKCMKRYVRKKYKRTAKRLMILSYREWLIRDNGRQDKKTCHRYDMRAIICHFTGWEENRAMWYDKYWDGVEDIYAK